MNSTTGRQDEELGEELSMNSKGTVLLYVNSTQAGVRFYFRIKAEV